MGLRREVWQIIIGALLLALFVQTGILNPAKGFLDNVIVSIVLYVITRIIARMLGS